MSDNETISATSIGGPSVAAECLPPQLLEVTVKIEKTEPYYNRSTESEVMVGKGSILCQRVMQDKLSHLPTSLLTHRTNTANNSLDVNAALGLHSELDIKLEPAEELKEEPQDCSLDDEDALDDNGAGMEEGKKPHFKYCIVPMCKNNIRNAPDKVFFHIPRDANLRKKWCKVMKKDNISPKSTSHCCEDHFNIKDDTENYMEYKVMYFKESHKISLRLKKGVLPHVFQCQKDKKMEPLPERKGALKRQRQALVEEAPSENTIAARDIGQSSANIYALGLHSELDNKLEREEESQEPQEHGPGTLDDDDVSTPFDVAVKTEKSEPDHDKSTESEVRTGEVPTLGQRWLEVELTPLPMHTVAIEFEPEKELKEEPQDCSLDEEDAVDDNGRGMEGKRPHYKYCIVPMCKNNIRNAPDKVYFHIPRDANLRKKWCKVMKKDNISPKSTSHCCEDHFNIKDDTENYMEYKVMYLEEGHKISLRLKKGVLPHVFQCQKDKKMEPLLERKGTLKRQRQALVEEAPSEYIIAAREIGQSSANNYSSPTTNEFRLKINENSGFHQIGDDIAADKDLPRPFVDVNPVASNNKKTHIEYRNNVVDRDISTTTSDDSIKITNIFINNQSNIEQDINIDSDIQSENQEYLCTLCKYTTRTARLLQIHLRVHSAARKYICDICSYIATQKYNLIYHIRIHTGEKRYVCEVCDKKFRKTGDLNRHIKTHTCKKPFAGGICDKKFSDSSKSNDHIRIHTKEKPYTCEICNKKFNRKSHLQVHIRIHTGEKRYACKICTKKFRTRSDLNRHIKTHTCKKPFAVRICDNKFSDSSKSNDHIRIHTKDKPYTCEMCNKKFNRKGHLQMHIRIHTGEKLYACEICDKKFTTCGSLTYHIRKHTDEKPYICEICNKRFWQSSHLKTHFRIHTAEKPHSCEICSKQFIRRGDLKRHISIHTGEKPYACKLCDKRFAQSGNLDRHSRSHYFVKYHSYH